MGDGTPPESRRRFLRLAGSGSVVGFAGCLTVDGDDREERPADWCLEELDDPPPESEQEALSIDGIERKESDALQPKEEVGYQCGPVNGELCGNCTFYIDDRSGDGIGACTEVEGNVRSTDWCALWAPREKMGDRE